jgi:hypothetical protein
MVGGVLRYADAIPSACLVARHKFAHGRNVRQRLRASCGGYRERPQLPGSDLLDRRWHGAEHHLHLPGDQVGNCRSGAAIWYVNHIDAGHCFEQLAGQVVRRSNAARPHVQLTGIGLGIGNKLGDRLDWN